MASDTAQQSPTAPAARRRGRLARVADFFFGDDVFISYSRRDASDYALALASRLTEAGFSCFLDQWGTEPGRELPRSLRNTLSRCGALVVIASPGAAQSVAVGQEITHFRALRRPILPISIDGAETGAQWYPQIAGLSVTHDTAGELRRGDPQADVVSRVSNALSYRKRSARLRRTLNYAAVGILVLLLGAGVLAGLAIGRAARETRRGDSLSLANAATERAQTGDVAGALQMALKAVAVDQSARSLRALGDALAAHPRLVYAFRPHGGRSVVRMAVSSTGSRLATCSDEGVVRVWNVGAGGVTALTGEPRVACDGAELAFGPRGEWLAAGMTSGQVLVWDSVGARVVSAGRVGASITRLAVRRDGVLATLAGDSVVFWRVAAGQPLARVGALRAGTGESLNAISFNPVDGTLAVSGPGRVWLTAPGGMEPRDSLMSDLTVRLAEFSPDGRMLAIRSGDGRAALLPAGAPYPRTLTADRFAGTPPGILQTVVHGEPVSSVDDQAIVRWRGWRPGAGEAVGDTLGRLPSPINEVVAVPSRGWVASAHFNGTVAFWAADASSSLTRDLPREVAVQGVDATATRMLLHSAGGLSVRTPTGRTIPVTPHPTLAAAIDPGGTRVAAAWSDTLALWRVDGTRAAPLGRVRTGIAQPARVRFGADGRLVVAEGDSGRVVAWNPAGSEGPRRLPGIARVLAVSPDGRRMAGADRAGQLVLTELGGRRPPRPLSLGKLGPPVAAVFTPGGGELLSYHQTGLIVRWRLSGVRRSAEVLDTLVSAAPVNPGEPVNAAHFSADGRRLAVAFWTELPVVWDADGPGVVISSPGRTDYGVDVALNGDGSALLTWLVGASDVPEAGRVLRTDASPGTWIRRACGILAEGPHLRPKKRDAVGGLCWRARHEPLTR